MGRKRIDILYSHFIVNALKYFNDIMKKIPITLSPYIFKLEFHFLN